MEVFTALYIPTDPFEPIETFELPQDPQAIQKQLKSNTIHTLDTGNPNIQFLTANTATNNDYDLNTRADYLCTELRTNNGIPTPTGISNIASDALIFGGYEPNTGKRRSLSSTQEKQLRHMLRAITDDYNFDNYI